MSRCAAFLDLKITAAGCGRWVIAEVSERELHRAG